MRHPDYRGPEEDEPRRLDDERARLDDEQDRLDDERARLDDEQDRLDDERARLDDDHKRLDDEPRRPEDEQKRLDDEQDRLDDERARLDDEQARLGLDDEQARLDDEQIGRPNDEAPLREHITWYVDYGYQVQSQTETSAQLVQPKVFSLEWALVWFLLLGVGVLVYLFYYAAKKDVTAYLYVEDGKVKSR